MSKLKSFAQATSLGANNAKATVDNPMKDHGGVTMAASTDPGASFGA